MKYFVVDAFTDELFAGNTAGVCLLEEFLPDELMQKIAAENMVSETAFVVARETHYDIRWFTPELEVDLCGHATLATAFVILHFIEPGEKDVEFMSQSGPLYVKLKGDLLEMDFPSWMPIQEPVTPQMEAAAGIPVREAWRSRNLILVVDSADEVANLKPDMELVGALPECFALIVTAPGDTGSGIDFVSRFFVPNAGIPEDPVTGSAHSELIPLWAEKLGKDEMVARQLSARGGTLYCTFAGERAMIAGHAVLYMRGELFVD
jgi:PhzF family phenazine biosynthesis protein